MTESFRDRIVTFIIEGDTDMVDTMLIMREELVSDYWGGEDNEGNECNEGNEGNESTKKLMSFLHVVALNPIVNYIKMIDVLLRYGININSVHKNHTPLDTAIINKNFPTAAYLQYKGGASTINSTTDYFTTMDTSLLMSLKLATSDLYDMIARYSY